MKEFLNGTVLVHLKESFLSNNFCSAIRNLSFTKSQYEALYAQIIARNSTTELEHYREQLNSEHLKEGQTIILENTRLSFYFKSYLVYVKAVLDKFVPFIKDRHSFPDKVFKSRGANLLKFAKYQYKGDNRDEIVRIIESARKDWLITTLQLRDEFIHNSSLREYTDFSIKYKKGRSIENLADFQPPTIRFKNQEVNAKEFILVTTKKLIEFINSLFNQFSFDKYTPPAFSTKCENCNYTFAELLDEKTLKINKPITLDSKHEKYQHGVIYCPNCNYPMDISLSFFSRFGIKI